MSETTTSTKLNVQIQELFAGLPLPPEVVEKLGQTIEAIKVEVTDPGLKVGDKAPDFKFANQNGQEVSLSGALEKGPVVVKFIRGAWCPICSLDVAALQSIHPQLKELGASLLVINPQVQEKSKAIESKHSAAFDILSDEKLQAIRDYKVHFTLPEVGREVYTLMGEPFDLPNQTADGSWDLPVPATFVVDKEGVIRARHVEADYSQRLEPEDLLQAVKNLG